MLKAILGLGLSEFDAQVFVFLALNGPLKAKQLTTMMKQNKQQIYRSLKRLEENNVVKRSRGDPAVFSAASFWKVLDLLGIKKEGQARALENAKKDLLDCWQKIIESNSVNAARIVDKKSEEE